MAGDVGRNTWDGGGPGGGANDTGGFEDDACEDGESGGVSRSGCIETEGTGKGGDEGPGKDGDESSEKDGEVGGET